MKTLRSILYVIIAMLLGIFINLLSLTFIFKNVVQDEIITNTIKTSIATGYLTKNIKDIDKLTPEQKKMLEDFLNDNDINEVVNVVMENYMNYQSDSNYKISQDDVDKLKDYVIKHQDLIKQASDEDFDINKITNEITVDNIDENARKVANQLDELPSEIKPIIKSYKYIIDGPIKIILIGLIIVCIALMMLISWSLIKWMKATGVCLITNGVLILLMFAFVDGIKDLILRAIDIKIAFANLSFNSILIIGLVELIIGIILVVVHNIVNKKLNKSNNENESINEENSQVEEA